MIPVRIFDRLMKLRCEEQQFLEMVPPHPDREFHRGRADMARELAELLASVQPEEDEDTCG